MATNRENGVFSVCLRSLWNVFGATVVFIGWPITDQERLTFSKAVCHRLIGTWAQAILILKSDPWEAVQWIS